MTAAASRGASRRTGLEHHRVAHLRVARHERRGLAPRAQCLWAAPHHGDARRRGELAGAHLIAEEGQRRRRGPDESDPGLGTGGGERSVLGQEAVAGMDAVRAAGLRRRDDRGHIEVRRDVRRGQLAGLRGHARVQAVRVGLRVDRDGLDPQPAAGMGAAAAGDGCGSGAERGRRRGEGRAPTGGAQCGRSGGWVRFRG